MRKLRASKKEADEAMAKVKKREQLAEARCEELVSPWSRTVASKRALQRPSHMRAVCRLHELPADTLAVVR